MADEIVTRQQLVDASTDADSLGLFISGPDTDDVLTRLGQQYPTLAKAVRIIQEAGAVAVADLEKAGGYISVPTLSILNAIMPLYNYQLARVEDTGDEYRWEPTVTPTPKWVATGRNVKTDITLVANEAAKQQIATVAFFLGNNGILHGFRDGAGNVYEFTDINGGKFLPGLDKSVQDEISAAKIKTALLGIEEGGNLYRFKDAQGNLGAYFDINFELYLTGLEHSVQYYLLNSGQVDIPFTCPKSYKTKADLYTVEVMAALESNTLKAPIGRGLLAQQYHLGESWLNKLSMPASTNRIVIGAYNDGGQATQWVDDSGVVHPNVIKFDEPVCGFLYWMGINPYTATNENFELPYIYGFNNLDLSDLTLITNFPQPFDIDPPNTGEVVSGHLSDSFFTYDPINAELWFCWRQTLYGDAGRDPTKAKQTFFGRKTKDGTNWSDRLVIYPQYTLNNDKRYSPSIMFNHKDGLFYLYYITFSGALGYETSESITNPNWKKIGEIQLPFIGWHLEMKWCGDMLVALVENDVKDELYLGITRDMKTFSWSPNLFNEPVKIYKSSFIPIFNDNNQIAFKIFYTTDASTNPQWQLHVTQTNFTNIED